MRIALAALVLVTLTPPALAQRVSAEDIINALQARGAAAAAVAPGRIRAGAQNLVVAPANNAAAQPRSIVVAPAAINPPAHFGNPGVQQMVVNPPSGGRPPVVSPMVIQPPASQPPPVPQMVVLPPGPQPPPISPIVVPPQGGGQHPIVVQRPAPLPMPVPVMEAGLPSIDLEIYFDTGSAEILPRSREQLIALGSALMDPRLAAQHFLVAGHTDARGTDLYNRDLSDRRAAAVRAFLIQQFPILPTSIQIVGYGEDYLRDPANPDAAINRRVQIVNLGQ